MQSAATYYDCWVIFTWACIIRAHTTRQRVEPNQIYVRLPVSRGKANSSVPGIVKGAGPGVRSVPLT